jgi:hypothetical protein
VAQRHALSDFDSDQFVQVHHREYDRVTTTAIYGLPREQYDVAFVDWQLRSIKALETMLDSLLLGRNVMADVGMLALIIVAFAVAASYARLCGGLLPPADDFDDINP